MTIKGMRKYNNIITVRPLLTARLILPVIVFCCEYNLVILKLYSRRYFISCPHTACRRASHTYHGTEGHARVWGEE